MSVVNKRYYWLKLPEDFFNRDDIKIIKSQKNGPAYLVFYLTLLTKSIENSGDLRFNELIPFNDEMLATITGTDIDIVRTALKLFKQLGLLEIYDDNTLHMIETKNMIGSETASTRRSRKSRAKNQPKLDEKNNKMLQCNTGATNCNGDIDIELDIDKDKDSCCNNNTNNKLDRESNKITDSQQQQILINDVEDVFKKLELKSNYKEFYQHYSLLNWKFHNNNSISLRALPKLAKNWEDNYLSKLKDNSLPEQVKKPNWLDEYVSELEKMEV